MSPASPWLADNGGDSAATAVAATAVTAVAATAPALGPQLNDEQLAAAHAPLDEALAVLAAAGTGKTTTMLERVCHALRQVRGSGLVWHGLILPNLFLPNLFCVPQMLG